MRKQEFMNTKISNGQDLEVFGRNLDLLAVMPSANDTDFDTYANTYFNDYRSVMSIKRHPTVFFTNAILALDYFAPENIYWFDGNDTILNFMDIIDKQDLVYMTPFEIVINDEMFQ